MPHDRKLLIILMAYNVHINKVYVLLAFILPSAAIHHYLVKILLNMVFEVVVTRLLTSGGGYST